MTSLPGLRALALLAFAPVFAAAQSELPAGTPLAVALPGKLPLRAGEPLRALLVYPVYLDNHVVLPERTVVLGKVTALTPNRPLRNEARFNGDFTPFRTPVVEFSAIELADGTTLPFPAVEATDGAPILHLTPGPPKRGGFIRQGIDAGKQAVRDQIVFFTGPGHGDRLTELLWHQLPYHPQRIGSGTAWTVVTSAPLTLPADSPARVAVEPAPTPEGLGMPGFVDRLTAPEKSKPQEVASAGEPPVWDVEAYLEQTLSSDTSHAGDKVTAHVARPVLAADGAVLVPQGALLRGTVSQARPARRFAHAGTVRFNFTKLELPDQPAQAVRTSLAAADTRSARQLSMDSEGNVQPDPPSKAKPLILAALTALAVKPDGDGGGAAEQAGKSGVASNSLGLIGFVVGFATHSPVVGGAIGAYGTAVASYRAYLARGKETTFPANTRLVVRTQATRSAELKPGG